MQIQRCVAVQDLQDKTGSLIGKEIPYPSVHERTQYRGIFQTYGKNLIVRHHDTHRDRSIPFFVISFLDHRNIYQDQCIVILHFDTRTFLLIQRCPQMIHINIIFLCDFHNLGGSRIDQRDPASLLCFIDLMHIIIYGSENLNHVINLPSACLPLLRHRKCFLSQGRLIQIFYIFIRSRIRPGFHL